MTTEAMWEHDVFISYSHGDYEWVHTEFVPRLQQEGVRVFTDAEFRLGRSSVLNMEEAVTKSRHTVLVMTPEWVKSDWADFEAMISIAVDPSGRRSGVIPVLLRDCTIPPRLNALTRADFSSPGRIDGEFARLVNLVKMKHGDASADPVEPEVTISDAPAPLSGDAVTETLRTVGEFLKRGPVRAELTAFSFRLSTDHASEQITTLLDFKKVHDLLHHLQLHCYDPIKRDSRDFPDDASVESLGFHVQELETTIVRLRKTGGHSTFELLPLTFIDSLQNAHRLLLGAIEMRDAAALRKAAQKIDFVLSVEPVRINTRLNDAAHELRLGELIDAIRAICDPVRSAQMPGEKLAILQNGLQSMIQLDLSLSALVRRHDDWQLADQRLRCVASSLLACVDELVDSWPDLKAQITALIEEEQVSAPMLDSVSAKLEAAILNDDWKAMSQHFGNYRREVVQRFFQVDLKLLWQCEELRKVLTRIL